MNATALILVDLQAPLPSAASESRRLHDLLTTLASGTPRTLLRSARAVDGSPSFMSSHLRRPRRSLCRGSAGLADNPAAGPGGQRGGRAEERAQNAFPIGTDLHAKLQALGASQPRRGRAPDRAVCRRDVSGGAAARLHGPARRGRAQHVARSAALRGRDHGGGERGTRGRGAWHCAAPSVCWTPGGPDHDAGRHRPGARRRPRADAAVASAARSLACGRSRVFVACAAEPDAAGATRSTARRGRPTVRRSRTGWSPESGDASTIAADLGYQGTGDERVKPVAASRR